MPRTCGLSTSVRRLCILLSPSPIKVARWIAGRLMGLPICSTTIVLRFSVLAISVPLGSGLSLACAFASAVSSPRDDLAHLLATPRRDATRAVLMAQRVEGGAHHVVRVRAA